MVGTWNDILESCRKVVALSNNVSIDYAAMQKEIQSNKHLYSVEKLPSSWAQDYHWAITDSSDGQHNLLCQYIFVLDALNFCFWPIQGYEYAQLAGSLKNVLLQDIHSFDAENLSRVSAEEIKRWLFGDDCKWEVNDEFRAAERSRLLNQVGSVLLEKYDGLAKNVVIKAQNSAEKLVEIIVANFPGFRDHSVYKGFQVFLYKRAQILVGDLWGAFEGQGLGYFHDIHNLTCFADYRIPQLLRHLGIFKYSDQLSDIIDNQNQLCSGSHEEMEIRAATVIAVEEIKKLAWEHCGNKLISVQIDWLLWERGEEMIPLMKPHHRTLTIYY